MRRDACAWLVCALVVVLAPVAHGAPLVEVDDRLEVNWSTLRVRFFGEAAVGSGPDGFKAAEKQAWHEGMDYASGAVRSLNMTLLEQVPAGDKKAEGEAPSEDAARAAKQIAGSTHSYNTTYFADGTVRVHLESALPKALTTAGIRFRQLEAPEPVTTQFTGIVLRASASTKPRALYQIVDEQGALLFDVRDMAQEAYKKNLMGRWFRRPSGEELSEAVGKSPLSIAAVPKDGRFVVQRQEWEEAVHGHKSLLVSGTIAVALP